VSSRDSSRALRSAYGAVRISPDGECLAWYRPGFEGDPTPWLVIREDAVALGVQHDWSGIAEVAEWTPLQDVAVVLADERTAAAGLTDDELTEGDRLADLSRAIRAAADPVPAGLTERIRVAAARELDQQELVAWLADRLAGLYGTKADDRESADRKSWVRDAQALLTELDRERQQVVGGGRQ
jgi:hypothetical protein